MSAWYNEHDPYAAAWLRNLIDAGQIAPGVVDERDIRDVRPDELSGFTQCHFFAGIGVWSYALRRRGWPDTRRVWTGSCPCQPFSAAGKGAGFDDERHLWPSWFHLISQCRPERIYGEQVASADGLGWLDLVQADLEAAGYAVGALDLCAAGVGAPHIRQRLWFMADADGAGSQPRRQGSAPLGYGEAALADRAAGELADAASGRQRELGSALGTGQVRHADCGSNSLGELADADGGHPEQPARQRPRSAAAQGGRPPGRLAGRGDAGELGHTDNHGSGRDCGGLSGAQGSPEWGLRRVAYSLEPASGTHALADAAGRQLSQPLGRPEERNGDRPDRPHDAACARRPGPVNGFWRDADWLLCRDGKWRPVEPGTFPLAHGAPARVGRLRAYGNAICAEAAETFIEATLDDGRLRVTLLSVMTADTGVFA